MSHEPPRKDTPFWIIGDTYEQVCATCWGEKLSGMKFLPDSWLDPKRSISWYNASMKWPLKVPLRAWPGGNNWVLEFKSYGQGREAMQARSIGGFWFSEQFPWNIFEEVLARCRQYMFPGGQFAEFTPLNPDLCIAMEQLQDNPPPGWHFYRLNTAENKHHLSGDWFESFFAHVPKEMLATRMTGALATFSGVIFESFHPAIHVIDRDEKIQTPGMTHHRAFDWGASVQHPFAGVWGCRDGTGDWYIYDEYWDTAQTKITQDHATEIMARSLAWGWPEPEFFAHPTPSLRPYVETVRQLVPEGRRTREEIARIRQREGKEIFYSESFGDPSRPDNLNTFNYYGLATSAANNSVMRGIDVVRSYLQPSLITEKPRIYIHPRCKHLIEELRKYRWDNKERRGLTPSANTPPKPLKIDDDTVDALRYLIASTELTKEIKPSVTSFRPVRTDVPLTRQHDRPNEAAKTGFFRRK